MKKYAAFDSSLSVVLQGLATNSDRASFGPRAPTRKRKKRLAKKLKLRGGMLRARGPLQDLKRAYFKAWPEAWWMGGRL